MKNDDVNTNVVQVEVNGVIEVLNDNDCSYVQVDNKNPQFYSVYLRMDDGLAECVCDFKSLELAKECAKLLSAEHNVPYIIGC